MSNTYEWIQEQLQNEYAAKLKIEGTIAALEAVRERMEAEICDRSEAVAEQRCVYKQASTVSEPTVSPTNRSEDLAELDTCDEHCLLDSY